MWLRVWGRTSPTTIKGRAPPSPNLLYSVFCRGREIAISSLFFLQMSLKNTSRRDFCRKQKVRERIVKNAKKLGSKKKKYISRIIMCTIHTSGVFIFGATILANQFNKVLEVILHWRVFARNVKMEASASSLKKKKARALLTYFYPHNKNQAKAVDPLIAAITSNECSTTTTSNFTSPPVSLPDS